MWTKRTPLLPVITLTMASSIIITGCAQKTPSACTNPYDQCTPTPPRTPTKVTLQGAHSPEHSITTQSRSAIARIHHNTANRSTSVPASKPSKVVIIETLRKPYLHTRPQGSPEREKGSLPSPPFYTLQLGAYQKSSNLHRLINSLDDKADLFTYSIKTNLQGIAYGQFKTIDEAKAQHAWLTKHGIDDFLIRKLPANAKAL
ncbi:hypothetical protein WNY58_07345 [Neptuniibacter pectenicola]|uniref:SPOR domain-containing protein n=1 Tax=Neptuniibacter pectenicola TaxID=1806669 RepID=A0ABU9TR64_9GAMM